MGNRIPMMQCVYCQKPTSHFVTQTGTAYGHPFFEPQARRGGRRSGGWVARPQRPFEVRVPLCDRCDALRASRVNPELPLWMQLIKFLSALVISVMVLQFWANIQFSLIAFIAAIFVLGTVMASIDNVIRKDKRIFREAVNINLAIGEISKKLLAEKKDEVEDAFRLEQQERLTRLDHLQELGGYRFEELMTRLFSSIGFSARRTRGSRDGGVDIEAERGGETVLIQCKNHKYPIGPAPVRDLFGVMASTGAHRGILVCTSTFTEAAKTFAKKNRVELIDGKAVIEMIKRHNLG
jgi:hypothetical protein